MNRCLFVLNQRAHHEVCSLLSEGWLYNGIITMSDYTSILLRHPNGNTARATLTKTKFTLTINNRIKVVHEVC